LEESLPPSGEIERLRGGVKAMIEELEKQDYAAVDAILRELDRRLDRLTAHATGRNPQRPNHPATRATPLYQI
jgi:ribosome-associated translation inhibitor RaiA